MPCVPKRPTKITNKNNERLGIAAILITLSLSLVKIAAIRKVREYGSKSAKGVSVENDELGRALRL